MMVVFSILLGTILGWLYLNTQSPWTPALAHGSVNAVAGLPVLFLEPGFDVAGQEGSVEQMAKTTKMSKPPEEHTRVLSQCSR